MGLLDVLRTAFAPAPAAPMTVPSAAPPAAAPPPASPGVPTVDPAINPQIAALLQQYGYTPPDPEEDRRRAIASALAKGSAALATSTQNFFPALAAATGAGAVDYTGTREAQAAANRTDNRNLLNQMFGLDKAYDRNEITGEIAKLRDDATNRRIDELIRNNIVRGNIAQQNADTAATRTDEYGRHNVESERIAGQNADTNAQNADTNAKRAADNAQAQKDRIKLATEEGARHAKELQAKIDSGYFNKSNSGKSDNAFWQRRAIAAQLKRDKMKELRLNDPVFSITDPEGYKAAQDEYQAYSKSLDADVESSRPKATTAPGSDTTQTPAPTTTPQPKGAAPDTKDLNLPPDIAGKVVRRTTKNGKTYVKLDDGRVFEVQP